jgi:hypothetical protein
MALARAVILGAESLRTHDHILLFRNQDSPNLENQVPVFIKIYMCFCAKANSVSNERYLESCTLSVNIALFDILKQNKAIEQEMLIYA